jgi:RNA polymerase sigma-70 factor, ECF subfamily
MGCHTGMSAVVLAMDANDQANVNSPLDTFSGLRPRLFGVAYRMLGSRAEAEDALQDTYIRWHESDRADVQSAEGWLVTIVVRLCIDRLRAAKTERAAYTGPWLPEPIVSADVPSPEGVIEMANDVSIAFLTVLERLGVEERAAFLLREVFDVEYIEIAQILGKSAAACRQLVHRAKERVQEARPRFTVSRDAHIRLLERFMAAAATGDREHLRALFAEDATLTSDGGGKVIAVLRVLRGADRIARFYHAVARRGGWHGAYRLGEVNGAPGLLRYKDGKVDSAVSFVTDGVRILDVYIVRNPDKLYTSGASSRAD